MITPEEFYERLGKELKKTNQGITNYELVISNIVGKRINLRSSKQKGNFPVALAIPFMDFPCFNDDELHYMAISRMATLKEDDIEGFDALDNFIAELEPSKEYLEKQRIKRFMQRQVLENGN